ncbi:hypothetical protein GCM10010096_13540 [Alcaligenes pakistanensis]|uniref:Uncharacterized protein n=1 Tax=Alcaligenes pakistanensis TaxID=1482717 RepID=A0A8H9IKE6_9BURK|nr:hypothetical protein GCM10010096_13540 [Alcaligenes pakistanensis]
MQAAPAFDGLSCLSVTQVLDVVFQAWVFVFGFGFIALVCVLDLNPLLLLLMLDQAG